MTGNYYISGTSGRVAKFDSDHNLIWQRESEEQGDVFDMAFDSSANIFFGTDYSHFLAYSNTGENLVDTTATSQGAIAIHKDTVYLGDYKGQIYTLNLSGDVLNIMNVHDKPIRSLAIDSKGHILSGGKDNKLIKTNSKGKKIWEVTFGDMVYGLAVDGNDCIYAGADCLKKLSPSGHELWKNEDYNEMIRDVVLDENENVYTIDDEGVVAKVDATGDTVWRKSVFILKGDGVTITTDGYLYALSQFEKKYVQMSTDGVVLDEFSTEDIGFGMACFIKAEPA